MTRPVGLSVRHLWHWYYRRVRKENGYVAEGYGHSGRQLDETPML